MNFYTFPHGLLVKWKGIFIPSRSPLNHAGRYMVYLTKRAGKYKILSRVRVKKLLPREAKRSKIPSQAAVGRRMYLTSPVGREGIKCLTPREG